MRRLYLALILLTWIGLFLAAANIHASPADVRQLLQTLPAPEAARAWLDGRRTQLLQEAERPAPAARMRLRADLETAASAAAYLAKSGGSTDARGFTIYSPQVTLRLFLLDRLAALERAALRGRTPPEIGRLWRLGGQTLTETAPEKYPSPARARKVLAGLRLPDGALRGYRVYLLPYAMGEVSGQGGPGYVFLAAEPKDELLIPNQLEVTLAHEFGHYLHLVGMPHEKAAGRKLWRGYLRLRHLAWRDDGRVNTDQWRESPEETFAEDFRLLFGGSEAAGASAATSAGDPRAHARTAAGVRAFMRTLTAKVHPPANLPPWPEAAD